MPIAGPRGQQLLSHVTRAMTIGSAGLPEVPERYTQASQRAVTIAKSPVTVVQTLTHSYWLKRVAA